MKTDILKKTLQSVLGSCRGSVQGQAWRNMDNFLAHRSSSSLLMRKNVDLIVTRRLLSSSSSHLSGSSNLRLRPTPSSYKDNATPKRFILTSPVAQTEAEWIEITFVRGDGTRIPTKAKVGDNILDVVVNNSIDLDGFGACEGTLACSTCHVVFKNEDFEKVTEKVTDEEMDMLDMAYGLTDTSRLGCQVCLKKDMDGLEIKVPAGVHDARS